MNRYFLAVSLALGVSLLSAAPVSSTPTAAESAFQLNEEAVALSNQERFEDAYEKIRQAFLLDSRDEIIRSNRLRIGQALAARMSREGKHREAIDLLESLRNLGGKEQDDILRQLIIIHNNYGVLLADQKNPIEADQQCLRAVNLAFQLGDDALLSRIKGVYSQFLTSWGQEWMVSGKSETGKIKLLEAIRHDERNVAALRLLSRIHFDSGEYRQAEHYLQQALRYQPKDADLQEQLEQVQKEAALDRNMTSRRRGMFQVEFSGREEYDLVSDVFSILNDARRDIGRLFDYYPVETLLVRIYNEQHSEALGMGPDWASAIYDGKIRVRAEIIRQGGANLKDVLYHEYAHAVLFYLTRHNIPTWLNEGLAQYVEPKGQITAREEQSIRRKIERREYIPVAKLDGPFVTLDADNARQAYIQSKLFVRFLVDRFGEVKMRKMLSALSEGNTIEQAAKIAYARPLHDLELQWAEELIR